MVDESELSPSEFETELLVPSNVSNTTSSGATLLILLQFLTKLVTFALNQVLIRFISPKIFGIASYLDFLVSTILFFSREGARLAIQRTVSAESISGKDAGGQTKRYGASTSSGVSQSIVNFGFIPLLVGIPLSFGVFYWQYHTSLFQDSISKLPYHQITISLIFFSIILETSVEPIYMINQFNLNFKRRSKIEGIAILVRCVSTVGVIILYKRLLPELTSLDFDGLAVLAFGLGQFAYSFTVASLYILSFISDNEAKPAEKQLSYSVQKIYTSDTEFFYFNGNVVTIWKNLFVQMIFKQFLTEGDKLLINYLCTLEEQGVYSVITNYGSIIARLVFQPIEESIRLMFTRMFSSLGDQRNKSKVTTENKANIARSYEIMKNLSIFYLNFSILILLAGVNNSSYLLKLLLGSKSTKWANTNVYEIFPQYVIYIPLLAFNGIFEAFFSSFATSKRIQNFSLYMTFSSVVVLVSSYVFIDYYGLGLSGLILSNSINMLLRIIYCSSSIKQFFKSYNMPVSTLEIVNRTKNPINLAVFLELVHHKIILNGAWFTTTFKQFAQSALVCSVGLIGLCFAERDLIMDNLDGVLSRFKTKKD